MKSLLTVRHAAQTLSVSAATVYGLCALGRIRFSRVGLGRGVIRITEEAITEYLNGVVEVRPAPPLPRPRLKLKFIQLKQA